MSNASQKQIKIMKVKATFVLTAMLLTALTGYGQEYGIDASRPVNVADVKVTAVNNAYFTPEGIVVVSPDEDPGPALARRRVGGMQSEGSARSTCPAPVPANTETRNTTVRWDGVTPLDSSARPPHRHRP